MSAKNIIRRIIILLMVFIPLFFWLLEKSLSLRFANLNNTTTSLGQIFGLSGLTLMAITVILSARLSFLEDYFRGLNRIYLKHHNYGGTKYFQVTN